MTKTTLLAAGLVATALLATADTAQAYTVNMAGAHSPGTAGIILAAAKHKYAITGVNVDDDSAGDGKTEGKEVPEGKEGAEGSEGASDNN